MKEVNIKVLCVEDNTMHIQLFKKWIMRINNDVDYNCSLDMKEVHTLDQAIDQLENETFDVVLLDLQLPDSQGLETVTMLIDYVLELPFIILTGRNDNKIAMDALQKGVQDYLVKETINVDLLVRSIRYSIERHKMMSMVRALALIDELTGLYNRRGFMELAEHHTRFASRKKNNLTIIYIDIDNMKFINDTLGHNEGDTALCTTAKLLKNSFRGSDIVSRLGGDEFAVLALDTKDDINVVNRLRINLEHYNQSEDKRFEISLSYGISVFQPEDRKSVNDLIEEADNAMYLQKKEKKGDPVRRES